MEEARPAAKAGTGRRRPVAVLRELARAGRARVGAGLQYWQAGGSTRAAIKRAKRP